MEQRHGNAIVFRDPIDAGFNAGQVLGAQLGICQRESVADAKLAVQLIERGSAKTAIAGSVKTKLSEAGRDSAIRTQDRVALAGDLIAKPAVKTRRTELHIGLAEHAMLQKCSTASRQNVCGVRKIVTDAVRVVGVGAEETIPTGAVVVPVECATEIVGGNSLARCEALGIAIRCN